jgi:glycosyltransferase involved in cell wall biosynthesis
VAEARRRLPELRAKVFGDGPEREAVLRTIGELGVSDAVEAPGFVAADEVESAMREALCLLLPSRREGYGLVVVEASAAGTPSIVVRDPDNAATELIAEGENGFVAPSADAEDLAAAILRVHEAGDALRRSTGDWFRRNARRLSLESSLETVLAAYEAEA